MQILAHGTVEMLNRPCVDCGLVTGCYCDWCRAADRLPDEEWADGHQMTPLCTFCDRKHDACHYCRGQLWCVPPPHLSAGSQSPEQTMPDVPPGAPPGHLTWHEPIEFPSEAATHNATQQALSEARLIMARGMKYADLVLEQARTDAKSALRRACAPGSRSAQIELEDEEYCSNCDSPFDGVWMRRCPTCGCSWTTNSDRALRNWTRVVAMVLVGLQTSSAREVGLHAGGCHDAGGPSCGWLP